MGIKGFVDFSHQIQLIQSFQTDPMLTIHFVLIDNLQVVLLLQW